MQAIREPVFRELVRARSATEVRLVGTRGGYAIHIFYGNAEGALSTSRGDIRLFTLSSAARYVGHLGINRFTVDASGYEPGRLRKPRPDRAEALRKTRTRPRQASLV